MTLQKLLRECGEADFLEMAKLWKEKQPEWEQPLDLENCAAKVQKFCAMLGTLDAEPSTDVLVALPVFYDDEKQVSAELFHKEEFHDKREGLAGKILPTFSPEDDKESLLAVLNETQDWMPEAYGYEFSKWEEILGAEVYPENYDHVGKNAFIAAALYELSFNGFTRAAQEARRGELKESIREMEKWKNLPEEEQNQHCYTWEELKEKFGIEEAQTEQEIEEDSRLAMLESVMTRVAWIEELQRLAGIL